MLFLGIDLGSSSIKISVLDGEKNSEVTSAFAPKQEMKINAPQEGWAEQDPEVWIGHLKDCLKEVSNTVNLSEIGGIGISYQMHGAVCVDKNQNVLRPSIIWCDSRAVEIGNKFLPEVGAEQCLDKCLNLPGNFTVSKLKWIEQNEPEIYSKIDKIMLPGDFIAMRLSGIISTSISGLSEGIAWDFKAHKTADFLFDAWNLKKEFIPTVNDSFGSFSEVSAKGSAEFGFKAGTPISYRGGDQPNNALSLGAVNPGDFVSTAGTSGVVYGVTDKINYDPKSRVNVFGHVNHTKENPRLGILMCINGCAILNNWSRSNWGDSGMSYKEMDQIANQAPEGCDGVKILPFGNGSERIYENQPMSASLHGIQFNIHNRSHLFRAVQEGVAFAFRNGFDIINEVFKAKPSVMKAGVANLFISKIFAQAVSNLLDIPIELYDTNGALGAARGAAVGTGYYKSFDEAFQGLHKVKEYTPDSKSRINEVYGEWKTILNKNY